MHLLRVERDEGDLKSVYPSVSMRKVFTHFLRIDVMNKVFFSLREYMYAHTDILKLARMQMNRAKKWVYKQTNERRDEQRGSGPG